MILIILSILSVLLPAAINAVNGISLQGETLYVSYNTRKYQVCQMVNRYIFIQFWYILEGLGIYKKIFYHKLVYIPTLHMFICFIVWLLAYCTYGHLLYFPHFLNLYEEKSGKPWYIQASAIHAQTAAHTHSQGRTIKFCSDLMITKDWNRQSSIDQSIIKAQIDLGPIQFQSSKCLCTSFIKWVLKTNVLCFHTF
jgi:hypothetical protein